MAGSAVFVFGQAGCPACADYVPRFKRLAAGAPFPVGVYDLAKDRHATRLADSLAIRATPTTVVMAGGRLRKVEGSVSDTEIMKLLRSVG